MSNSTAIERRLAAIFAADVEGYSRLMGADEVGTLKGLTERRAVLDKAIADHRGRIANTAGDSVLAEFGSAVDAVQCAVAAQTALAQANAELSTDRRINFRIGIHVGDVMVRAGDLFGDGVNIAARLQTLAQPGGVCLSGTAHEHVRKVLSVGFIDLGAQQVKNIEEPVRAYAISGAAIVVRPPDPSAILPLPDKPSIAVLPFQNMSGDPEQEYFADGMVEEIITALSRFKSLFVIARNSSFAYKGKSPDIRQVGRELGVRYVLEGSVRKAGGRVRITGQLIDATTGAHLWADRFEGKLEEVFELQDKVAGAVAGVVDPKILDAEIARISRKPVTDLNAYDCFLRSFEHGSKWTKQGSEEALRLLYRAIELDPNFAQAYAHAAWHVYARVGGAVLGHEETREAERLAREAARLGKDDALSLTWAGYTLAVVCGRQQEGAAMMDQALELNPNLARAWNMSGWIRIYADQPEIAIEHLQRAMRLNPIDPAIHAMETGIAAAHIRAGRYDEAARCAEKALGRRPWAGSAYILTLALAAAGDIEGARRAAQRLLEIEPGSRISNWVDQPTFSAERRARYTQLLRQAGLPE